MQLKSFRVTWKHFFSLILGVFCLNTIVLIGVVVVSSVKPYQEVLTNIWGIPRTVRWGNYVEVLIEENFLIYMFNTVVIAVGALVGQLYLAMLTAYGIARFRFRFRNVIYLYFLLGLMFPVQIAILPLFLIIRGLGLGNTRLSVMIIYIAALSFPVFILVSFLKSVPLSVVESAKIDGASEFTIFHRIATPLMTPVLAALVPLIIRQYWNDFFLPLVFLTVDRIKTIPLGLLKFYAVRGLNFSKLNLVFTASTIAIVPIVIVYLIASRRIIGGITEGAIKN
jgi:raffinose/stachyose/melibiose transport system permease protein